MIFRPCCPRSSSSLSFSSPLSSLSQGSHLFQAGVIAFWMIFWWWCQVLILTIWMLKGTCGENCQQSWRDSNIAAWHLCLCPESTWHWTIWGGASENQTSCSWNWIERRVLSDVVSKLVDCDFVISLKVVFEFEELKGPFIKHFVERVKLFDEFDLFLFAHLLEFWVLELGLEVVCAF